MHDKGSDKNEEVKPMFSFTESGNKVEFILVMPGLECSRDISKMFARYPDATNAKIIDKIFTEQSINYSIKVQSTMFRFQIQRLPTKIKPEKTKMTYKQKDVVKITLTKENNEPWANYADRDFELIDDFRP